MKFLTSSEIEVTIKSNLGMKVSSDEITFTKTERFRICFTYFCRSSGFTSQDLWLIQKLKGIALFLMNLNILMIPMMSQDDGDSSDTDADDDDATDRAVLKEGTQG